ncbi:LptA/OstA family protein [Jannaschia sp. CCS1]|uniref:LptA/OstA family protein n=1 Tax=Jannaschia sp. (strain CCS1) TaxID=290400 RepID=UPI000053CFAE|nr:LptA/OstA family protein [Jannaschia sp. CCS1]ABD53143.1 OstA-like protein [Jannaschia sp. CCS1]
MHRILALLGVILCLTTPLSAQVNIGFGGVAYDSSQPVEVTSDALTVDQTTGEAVFTGNVIVVQGDLRMAASAVRVLYTTDGNQDISEVIATGGVLITRGTEAAEGNSAVFNVASSLLTLRGNVLVTQGQTAIAGDNMVVDMTTGSGTVDGRVRTVLGGSE